jgi:hypothetical protein
MVDDALTNLTAAVAEVRRIDVDTLTDDENERLMYGCTRARFELLLVESRSTRRWDQSCTWASDGSKSPAARFARDVNCSLREARQGLRFGRALDTMPHTAAALGAAEISPAHVELLIAANNETRRAVFAVDEEMLVGHARTLRFAEFTTAIKYWCQRVDPDSCERVGRDLLDKRSLTLSTTLDDAVYLQGLLDPVGGEIFRNGLERIIRDLKKQDKATGVVRTLGERRAAALVEMAIRANTAPKDGKRPEPLIMAIIGSESLSRLCELASGTVITPGLLVSYLTSMQIQGIVLDDSQPIPSMSPKRTFTGWLRRAIQIRDRHCQHPAGCDEPITRCDIDHVIPDTHGGRTEYTNGRLLCQTHNRNPTYDDRAPPAA